MTNMENKIQSKNDLTCRLCRVSVDSEDETSFCSDCHFYTLTYIEDEEWIFQDQVEDMGWTYATVPVQILNPFDSRWDEPDVDEDVLELINDKREASPHLEKWKDIPQEEWKKEIIEADIRYTLDKEFISGEITKQEYEQKIRRSDFAEFIKISGAEQSADYIIANPLIPFLKSLHPKEELTAVIHIDDLNRFSRAVSFCTSSILEEGDWHDFDKKLIKVYAKEDK